jgi:DNA-binding transcriptional ArsR family regulator
MFRTAALAETAALVGDPARASMLMTLMDGRALTASELARAAGITPQTASGHLARLCTAGLLSIQRQGRHRYHRLASPAVAHMLETIMDVAQDNAATPRRPVVTGPRDRAMRAARSPGPATIILPASLACGWLTASASAAMSSCRRKAAR